MRYSRQLVQEVTHEQAPIHSVVGWAGTQKNNDTLTWGQQQTLNNKFLDAGALEIFEFQSQQVTRVFYERPTCWQLKIQVSAPRPAAETASFTIFWAIQIGVGTTFMTLQRSHSFTVPAPGSIEFFEPPLEQFPAQAVQVDVQAIVGVTGVIAVGSHVGGIVSLIAPVVQ